MRFATVDLTAKSSEIRNQLLDLVLKWPNQNDLKPLEIVQA